MFVAESFLVRFCYEAQASSASTGGVLTALRAGNTLASSAATAATASTMPLMPHSNGNTTLPYMLNTTYAPSQPNSVPSSTPEMPDTSEMSRASTARERRNWPRVMPMARSVADSRVRSITDSDSVLATPTSAMSTATAINPPEASSWSQSCSPIRCVRRSVRSLSHQRSSNAASHVVVDVVNGNSRLVSICLDQQHMGGGIKVTIGEMKLSSTNLTAPYCADTTVVVGLLAMSANA